MINVGSTPNSLGAHAGNGLPMTMLESPNPPTMAPPVIPDDLISLWEASPERQAFGSG